ncbi:deoxyribodipyrimidine photo-lyase [Lewinella aquimaris]|uniref:Deoxyribodipyrimidine photo-lyase n=1 Tax=Neolewinella aquimaris TaxID=1835722 RepID=A0A840EF81_9BACT|nr:deoxyribodipyrimidine photo-lyase [Neolewinella aquimaris]MBB4080459.1 deoxyribodipyrimidine photo-lyase [Neolewinella aquimaris]
MTIFWHRRDLRFTDNAGLYRALKTGDPVLPIFIFDRNILDKLPNKADVRVEFIQRSVEELAEAYRAHGSDLRAFYGKPIEVFAQLRDELNPTAVYTNRDYEPYAIARDLAVKELLDEHDIPFRHFKDHVIFESDEVQKQAGGPYTVYTPYMRRWKKTLDTRMSSFAGEKISFYLKPYPTETYADNLLKESSPHPVPTLADMGFKPTDIEIPPKEAPAEVIEHYDKTRDFPGQEGTSRISHHLRHGTVSVRAKVRRAMKLNETFVKELIWRDFYSNILQEFPRVVNESYRREYDNIPWINDEEQFEKWCEGKTGVPIVDAGMRQLNAIGWMHNRVRMITASYLTKHLLIDWRWGEGYFADKLLDYELASNNGGWQWAAGSGVDAQPYFRIFNYESQQRKFDKDYRYVKRWVPEYGTDKYPAEPLVEHKFGRERALRVYKEALREARET